MGLHGMGGWPRKSGKNPGVAGTVDMDFVGLLWIYLSFVTLLDFFKLWCILEHVTGNFLVNLIL